MHFYFHNKKRCIETMKSLSLRFLVLLISISKFVVLFFFSFRPLTSGRKYLDWSEDLMEVVAGEHVYPADPIGVQWDSNPPIWKAMEAHWCCSAQNIIILQIQRFCMSILKARERHWSNSNCSSVLLASLFHF